MWKDEDGEGKRERMMGIEVGGCGVLYIVMWRGVLGPTAGGAQNSYCGL